MDIYKQKQARNQATEFFAELMELDDFVVLDTETTGLEADAEIVQIAMINKTGEVLLDTYVKPTEPINELSGAFRVNGIKKRDVENAPTFAELVPKITELYRGKVLIIYNADYDTRLIVQSAKARKTDINLLETKEIIDAMVPYAAYVGEWSDYRGDYKWQKLPDGGHTALSDCQATLALIKRLASGG
jgi:DNA polymerase-3 subunit epsilon